MTYFRSDCDDFEPGVVKSLNVKQSNAHGGGSGGSDVEKSSDVMDD